MKLTGGRWSNPDDEKAVKIMKKIIVAIWLWMMIEDKNVIFTFINVQELTLAGKFSEVFFARTSCLKFDSNISLIFLSSKQRKSKNNKNWRYCSSFCQTFLNSYHQIWWSLRPQILSVEQINALREFQEYQFKVTLGSICICWFHSSTIQSSWKSV